MGKFSKILVLFFVLGTITAFALPEAPQYLVQDYENLKQVLRSQGVVETLLQDAIQYLKKKNHTAARDLTEVEFYFTQIESGYGFARAEDTEKELIRIIEAAQIQPHSDQKELILGDAYHWLGHIYQERFDLLKAYESFIRSFFHYTLTTLTRSPRINSKVEVHEHSRYHLRDIQNYLLRSVSGMRYFEEVVNPRQAIQSCKQYFGLSAF